MCFVLWFIPHSICSEYVKWNHAKPQDAKFVVESATVVMQTETNEFEFVAGKLEGDKEYIVKVSVKSSHRDILASGTHSIPLPREEHVPTPQGVRVIAVKKSLRVDWDVSPMHYA